MTTTAVGRGAFLRAAGSLTLFFATGAAPAYYVLDPASLPDRRNVAGERLDGWLRIDAHGAVVASTGKVDLGTGLATALAQIVAEELDVPFAAVQLRQGQPGGPDQGGTFGSYSVQFGGVQLRAAAAEARAILVAEAARRLGVDAARIATRDGRAYVRTDPSRSIAYGRLVDGRTFARPITGLVEPKDPRRYTLVGTPVARTDIPAKVRGAFRYVHDVRVAGMRYGVLSLPPRYGAHVTAVDESSIAGLAGHPTVVHTRDFVGVVADTEAAAIAAGAKLAVSYDGGVTLPAAGAPLYDAWRAATPLAETDQFRAGDVAGTLAGAARVLDVRYEWPYQIHGMIGPSCAVADIRRDGGTVWCGSQQLGAVAAGVTQLLGLPAGSVRVEYVEAAGSYGRLNNDDAAVDAAYLSHAVGAPVRVQWSRRDEHRISVKSPAMTFRARAALAGSRATAFDLEVTTPSHVDFSSKLALVLSGAPDPPPVLLVSPAFDAYAFPARAVHTRWLPRSLRRDASMRTLGALATTFAFESFVDEMAFATGSDPLAFRLHLMTDERAVQTLRAAANLARWTVRPPGARRSGRGRGLAYACYEGATHAAVVADVAVERSSGAVRVERLFVAQDCGLAVNPDGVRNQIEGGVLQATSRTLLEEVQWGERDVTSVDWISYPILRMRDVPDVHIALVNDVPGATPMGSGEAAGSPVAAAIANAVFDAVGARVRTAPLTPARVLAALA